MRFNPNPPTWKIICAVLAILLANVLQAITALGRLPETPYEIVMMILPALMLVFLFLGEDQPGENKNGK